VNHEPTQMRHQFIIISTCLLISLISCTAPQQTYEDRAISVLKDAVLQQAESNLSLRPITVTTDSCERSVGGLNDFYSEGDYWWPDLEDLDAPYIQKDGLTNPDNFIAHRESLMRFSETVGNLTSAYLITQNKKYAEAALRHCKAWFIDDATKMNPNLLYSQAIKGRHTGRDIGIIDAIHFMDVAQSLIVLEKEGLIEDTPLLQYKDWFSELVNWLTTHPYGLGERDRKNNHATWWNAQVAVYADFVGNEEVKKFCLENFKTNLLPSQMAFDGSFPEELGRTKPYSYSLFNLDAMAMTCLTLSSKEDNLWSYETDGKSVNKALVFMAPYVENKSKWPKSPDLQYWDNWPVAHPSYLFGAVQQHDEFYFGLWKENKHFLQEYEIRRTLANKSPIIWLARLTQINK
jgi:hypothetical protein